MFKLTLLIRGMFAVCVFAFLQSCTPSNKVTAQDIESYDQSDLLWANRLTWGADSQSLKSLHDLGFSHYLSNQLYPKKTHELPLVVQQKIDALDISHSSMLELIRQAEILKKNIDSAAGDEEKKAAKKVEQAYLEKIAHQSQERFIWRALYSSNQLQEQMTWFWMNHFSIAMRKENIRLLIGDYEDKAIRPNALGKFRDLLAASVYHPAMLMYLDNQKNSAGHINENYARELMELHTLGVNGGYSQSDVQELARILTGLTVDPNAKLSAKRGRSKAHDRKNKNNDVIEISEGVIFSDRKHDQGVKHFLGTTIQGKGKVEIDEVLESLSRQPAAARFISHKMAVYFLGAEPSMQLVDQMSNEYLKTDGDIAKTLTRLFQSKEMLDSLGKNFKDPMHYWISSLRLVYDGKILDDVTPAMYQMDKLGEPLYGHLTPDGYGLLPEFWNSSGQMETRFEVARSIGSSSKKLLNAENATHNFVPDFKTNSLTQLFLRSMSESSRSALAQSQNQVEWNNLFLSSPEFMQH